MQSNELQHLIKLLAKLPGLGPRSGRRAALYLIKQKEELMRPLAKALSTTADMIKTCETCGNLDTQSPCGVCLDPKRDPESLCIVEEVADLWALERTSSFRGRYHILGGTLSALEGVGPEDLRIPELVARVKSTNIREVILALNVTVEGQTTAHYLVESLKETEVKVTALAHGVPVGGELDYLDEGTLTTALSARRAV